MSTSPEPLVSVRNLLRHFGSVRAVDDVSFDLYPGQVVGFIGANGAGKTSTMRIMATLDTPDAGTVQVAGVDVINYPGLVRRVVGWMPDHFGAYKNMDVWEYLDFFARAYELSSGERETRIREVMEFTDLDVLASRPSTKLSKGQTQRLCLARTLLSDPQLLILDEPAAGLDPKARLEFKNLVRILKAQGKTIFISSHILSELAEMCDQLLFINMGRIVHQGDAKSLQYGAAHEIAVEVRIKGAVDQLKAWLAKQADLELAREDEGGLLSLKIIVNRPEGAELPEPDALLAGVLRRMMESGLPVCEFHRARKALEDTFVDMLRAPELPPAARLPSPPELPPAPMQR